MALIDQNVLGEKEMNLGRLEVGKVGSVSSRGILEVLPFGKSRRQKLVVGDDSGRVTCLECKRGEAAVVFRSRIGDNGVSCLTLGGSDGSEVFASDGRLVVGLNRKAKKTCNFKSNLSEMISCLRVRGNVVHVCGALTYAKYENGREKEYLNFSDPIMCMCLSTSFEVALIGCKDNAIRVLGKGAVVGKCFVGAAVTALCEYDSTNGQFFFGTEEGRFGMVKMEMNQDLCRIWEVSEYESEGSCVNEIRVHPLNKNDQSDVILARDDGTLQVFNMFGEQASLHFSRNVGESIRSIAAGIVTSSGFDEILICTFSGNIISFSTEELDAVEERDSKKRQKGEIDDDGRISSMKDEIKTLQKQIDNSRTKLKRSVKNGMVGPSQLRVNHHLSLQKDRGCFLLSVELAVPLHLLMLKSKVPFSLLEPTSGVNCQNSQVCSTTVLNVQDGTHQVICRCSEPQKRIQVRLRTIEGQNGEIFMTVISDLKPKVGRRITLKVKPLSMHRRCEQPTEHANMPYSCLSFHGEFAIDQAHDFMRTCLQDFPVGVPDLKTNEKEHEELFFSNVVTGSTLWIRYKSGEIILCSESISTLAILREVITRESNCRKINTHMKFQQDEASVPHFLSSLDRKFNVLLKAESDANIYEALREISNEESDLSFLTPHHQEVLHKQTPGKDEVMESLQVLQGVLSDLYIDIAKFGGKEARGAYMHEHLTRLFQSYNFEDMLKIFGY